MQTTQWYCLVMFWICGPKLIMRKFAASGDSYITSCGHGYFCRVFFDELEYCVRYFVRCGENCQFVQIYSQMAPYLSNWTKKGVQKMPKNTKKTLKFKESSESIIFLDFLSIIWLAVQLTVKKTICLIMSIYHGSSSGFCGIQIPAKKCSTNST